MHTVGNHIKYGIDLDAALPAQQVQEVSVAEGIRAQSLQVVLYVLYHRGYRVHRLWESQPRSRTVRAVLLQRKGRTDEPLP